MKPGRVRVWDSAMRIPPVVLAVLAASVLVGCSSGADDGSAPEATAPSATSLVEPAGPGSADSSSADSTPVDPAPASDPVEPEQSSAQDAGQAPATAVDPAIATWAPEQVCALLPTADVEQTTSLTVSEAYGRTFEGVGNFCNYDTDDAAGLAAKVEFGDMPFTSLLEMYAPADGVPPLTECAVGDRPGLCRDGFEDATTIQPLVIVQLGTEAEIGLVVSARTSTADAVALAEMVVTNLGL